MLLRALIVSLGYLCDHMKTCRLYCDKSMKRFAAICKLGEKPKGLQEGKGCAVHSL